MSGYIVVFRRVIIIGLFIMFHYNTIVFIVEGTGLLLKHKYTVSLQSDGCHHMRPKAEVLIQITFLTGLAFLFVFRILHSVLHRSG